MRLTENGRILERRIGRAATSVGALRKMVFGNRELRREAKMTEYNAVVVLTKAGQYTSNTVYRGMVVVVKTKTTSPVWAHFGLGASDKGKAKRDEVVYHLCAKRVVAKGSNTSNLLSHLRVHHQLKFTEVQKLQKQRGMQKNDRARL